LVGTTLLGNLLGMKACSTFSQHLKSQISKFKFLKFASDFYGTATSRNIIRVEYDFHKKKFLAKKISRQVTTSDCTKIEIPKIHQSDVFL
jgi:hypothetical protein